MKTWSFTINCMVVQSENRLISTATTNLNDTSNFRSFSIVFADFNALVTYGVAIFRALLAALVPTLDISILNAVYTTGTNLAD